MGTLNLLIKTNKDYTTFKENSDDAGNGRKLVNLIAGIASGAIKGLIDISGSSADPVAASGTLTLDTVIATDVATVGTITFTGTDTPSTELHFDTSLATDALIAADLAAKISAHSVIGQIVSASASGAVVTVTARQKGIIGNQIGISSVDATITASGAFLTGGTGGSQGAPEIIGRA